MDLVRIVRNDVFTDSKVIADGTNVTHRKIKAVIRTHVNDLAEFGELSAPYQAESTGGRPEYYRLNEQQATFLITLLKNTPTVTAFKKELVRQFFSMRAFLAPEAGGGIQKHQGIPESRKEAGNRCNQGSGGLRRGAGEPERSKVLFQPVKACR